MLSTPLMAGLLARGDEGLTYLASPYSVGNADAAERERRYQVACRVAWSLMQRGENIFCPIAHSHPIEVVGGAGAKPETHDFWLRQDFAILRRCTKMKVLQLSGIDWRKSVGITHELALAMRMNIPVEFITEDDLNAPETTNIWNEKVTHE